MKTISWELFKERNPQFARMDWIEFCDRYGYLVADKELRLVREDYLPNQEGENE